MNSAQDIIPILKLALRYHREGNLDYAKYVYQHMLDIDPQNADALHLLGVSSYQLGQYEIAVNLITQAIQIDPTNPLFSTNLGKAFRKQGKLEESIQAYQKAIQIQFDYAEAHIDLATIFLSQGQLIAGWKEYEWRWYRKRYFKRPLWNGTSLNGKSILVHCEQGFGDMIQFIRYIDLLPDKDTTIIFACQPELKPLFKSIDRINTLVTKGENIPDSDFYVPLLSLPYIFNTTLDTIPARIPYLYPNPKVDSVLLLDENHNLKIGIAWAGRPTHANDHNRSIDLKRFECLLGIGNCEFFSLQVGKRRESIKQYGYHHIIKDLGKQFANFHHTALAILQLDLVISVDTAVAHLAGALGKEVWTLLPFVPDWRWMLDRSDSPWYPSMTLFRQKKVGDWDGVFQQLKFELTQSTQD